MARLVGLIVLSLLSFASATWNFKHYKNYESKDLHHQIEHPSRRAPSSYFHIPLPIFSFKKKAFRLPLLNFRSSSKEYDHHSSHPFITFGETRGVSSTHELHKNGNEAQPPFHPDVAEPHKFASIEHPTPGNIVTQHHDRPIGQPQSHVHIVFKRPDIVEHHYHNDHSHGPSHISGYHGLVEHQSHKSEEGGHSRPLSHPFQTPYGSHSSVENIDHDVYNPYPHDLGEYANNKGSNGHHQSEHGDDFSNDFLHSDSPLFLDSSFVEHHARAPKEEEQSLDTLLEHEHLLRIKQDHFVESKHEEEEELGSGYGM